MAGATIVLFIMLTLINTVREKETSLSRISKEHVLIRQGIKTVFISAFRLWVVVRRFFLSDVDGGTQRPERAVSNHPSIRP